MPKKTPKPNRIGAWRVFMQRRWDVTQPFPSTDVSYHKKWLYDNEQAYNSQLKAKKTNVRKHAHREADTTRFVSETFDGVNWNVIEVWDGPSPNDCQAYQDRYHQARGV